MAKQSTKKATKPEEPEVANISGKRVTVVMTSKNPNSVEGRIRKINAKRAKKLVDLGWCKLA